MNDREKAAKLREKGWRGPSASEQAKQKTGRSRRSSDTSGDIVQALRNFDTSNPQGTAVPRSDASRATARKYKRGLPRLG